MKGRKLWFVGIGGAGLSAYAQLAQAWGATVGGWDRVRTPYFAALDGIDVEISPEPVVRDGWEAIVSSAYRRFPASAVPSSCASSSRRARRSSSPARMARARPRR